VRKDKRLQKGFQLRGCRSSYTASLNNGCGVCQDLTG